MSLWHNNLDSVYRRPPKPIGDAVQMFVEEQTPDSGGVLEDCRARVQALCEVIGAIASVLTPSQEAEVAARLRLKPGSDKE